jgi:hypothetical protein
MSQMSDSGTGVWVYGVFADHDSTVPTDTPGVAGETVRVVHEAGLAAIVGTVDLDRFGEDGLRRGLNDLDQLAMMARAHHAVVGQAARSATVAPTRLATVYENDDRVRAMLAQRHLALTSALRHVHGRQEYGVKAFRADRASAAEEPAATPTSGTDYLRQRQAALSAHEVSRKTAGAGAEAIHAELLRWTVGNRRHRPQDRQLSGDDRPMVLNTAYLVDSDLSSSFVDAVDRLASDHPELDVEVTGPWPPYSFAVVEDVEAGEPR